MKQIISFCSLFVLVFLYLLAAPFFSSVSALDITGSDSPEANFEQGSANNEVMHLDVSDVIEDTFLDGDGTLTTGAGSQESINPGDQFAELALAGGATLCGDAPGDFESSNIVLDTDGNCSGGVGTRTVILGSDSGATNNLVGVDLGIHFVDSNENSFWDNGEDIYYDADGGLYYNAQYFGDMYFNNDHGATLENEEISQVKLWYGYGVSRWSSGLTLMDECALSVNDWLCQSTPLIDGMQLFLTIDLAADATVGSTTKFMFQDGVIQENTYTQTVIAATPDNFTQQTAVYSHPSTTDAPQCNDNKPQGKINLFQIDTAGKYVNLYFTKAEGTVTGYSVNFGLTKDANQFGDNFSFPGPEWVIGRKVTHLSPNTTYYFKVRATNGCNAGEWSNIMHIKTKSVNNMISKLFSNLSI